MGNGMWVVAVFVSCCCLFTSLQPVISGCLLDGEEAAALHTLKASLLHSDINPPSSWVEGNDCCSWEGVGCSSNTTTTTSSSTTSTTIDTTNTSRRVVEALHLSRFAWPYTYPLKQWHLNLSVFKVFHELRHLDVSGNNFRRSLESLDITGLRKLEHLNLSYNALEEGRGIPTSSWTSLSSLRFLDLSWNRISGPFPSGKKFCIHL
ncbi:hypothetical protein Taro_029836 [Colocasia esculenta]|uniref:Leucine-rich repeat-containing N-terminal plant-type domain-containing protein n=1 Tax=Colocasia esculenta TaxID=4460 RepID=A0A843W1G7_COLES|nr:hypothetical protein [Colocasia esculenta]